MSHQHHHEHDHHHVAALQSLNGVFVVSIILNLAFVCVEAVVGLIYNSLGLLSDAGHNLSDVFSLLLALIAFRLSKLPRTGKYTYGYKKSTILISLLNAIILVVAVVAIVWESVEKIAHPAPINGWAISWTAGIGIVVNGLTAWLLMKNQKHDLNVRGAFLHMAADTLVSVGVVVSGVVISLTGWNIVDPIVSLVIVVIILVSTWKLLSESLRLSMDGVPDYIDIEEVEHQMSHTENVAEIHHLHIWAISTTEVALTAHVVLKDLSRMEATKHDIKQRLEQMGIKHSTLEMEAAGCECHEHACR